MAIKRIYFVLAFSITLSIFLGILLLGRAFDDTRQNFIDEESRRTYATLAEMQTFSLMAEAYGNDLACLAYRSKLEEFDENLWNLGIKLDQYRSASEEFKKDAFYSEQKRIFNENQVIYLTLLQNLKHRCESEQTIVLFFYENSETCKKCDDQSYVLTDINRDIDDKIAIFSLDTELNITAIRLLGAYYNVTEYPCTIIENTTLCGIQDRERIMQEICKYTEDDACTN